MRIIRRCELEYHNIHKDLFDAEKVQYEYLCVTAHAILVIFANFPSGFVNRTSNQVNAENAFELPDSGGMAPFRELEGIPMGKLPFIHCSLVAFLTLLVPALLAQNSITVFNPVNVRLAPGNTSGQPNKNSPPVNFNTSTINLNCPANPMAVLTSSASGTTNANLLVDNYIDLSVTPGITSGTVSGTPVDS